MTTTEVYDEALFLRRIQEYERRLQRQFSKLKPNWTLVDMYEEKISEYKTLLHEIEYFCVSVDGIFDGAIEVLDFLNGIHVGLAELSGVDELNYIKNALANHLLISSRVYAIEVLSYEQIKKLEAFGFSRRAINLFCSGAESEEEKNLLKAISEGRYSDAFAINPEKLSDSGQLFIALYARELVRKKHNQKELLDFVNGIMYTDDYRKPHGLPGVNKEVYGVEYFGLIRSTLISLGLGQGEVYSKALHNPKFSREISAGLRRELELTGKSAVLWGGLASTGLDEEVFAQIRSDPSVFLTGCRAVKIEDNTTHFSFILEFAEISNPTSAIVPGIEHTGSWLIDKPVEVKAGFVVGAEGVLTAMRDQKQTEQKKIIKKWEDEGLVDLTSSILGNAFSEIGLIYGFADAVTSQDISQIAQQGVGAAKDLEIISEGSANRAGTILGGISSIAAYFEVPERANAVIQEETMAKWMDWFGYYGDYTVKIGDIEYHEISMAGVPDADAIELASELDEGGVRALLGSRLKEGHRINEIVDPVLGKIEEEKKGNIEEIKWILNGGGEIYAVEKEGFVKAVHLIDEELNKSNALEMFFGEGKVRPRDSLSIMELFREAYRNKVNGE